MEAAQVYTNTGVHEVKSIHETTNKCTRTMLYLQTLPTLWSCLNKAFCVHTIYIILAPPKNLEFFCGVPYLEVSCKQYKTWNRHWTLHQDFGAQGILVFFIHMVALLMLTALSNTGHDQCRLKYVNCKSFQVI